MTYKGSSDKLSFISRTASHATKPRPSGLIEDIPKWAEEPEAYYRSVRDQYRALLEQLTDTQHRLGEIKDKLRFTLPLKEYEHLKQQRDRLARQHALLEPQVVEFRAMARAAGEQAWGMVFYLVAERLLSHEDFAALDKETQEWIGRQNNEIKKGQAGWSDQKRASQNQQTKLKLRRARLRKHQTTPVVVWRDE